MASSLDLSPPAAVHWELSWCSLQRNVCLASSRRELLLARGGPLQGARSCCWTLTSWRRDAPVTAGDRSLVGRKRLVEGLWREFFSDPSQWWDHRQEKVNPRFPDFKHKKTQQSLWLRDILNPAWVEAELAAMAPGAIQLSPFSWNKTLARYVKAGQYKETIEAFRHMQFEDMNLDKFTFIPVLSACANLQALDEGRFIHTLIITSGYESDVFVATSLVDMYAKCGLIDEAQRVFNNMAMRDAVAWNAMIQGYVKCNEGQKALNLFNQMIREGVEPNTVTFVGVLNACASITALEIGRHVHKQIIQNGCEADVFVSNCLIDMYAKCGSIGDAWEVFDKLPGRNVVSWNSMILGYAKCGEGHKALEVSKQMLAEGVEPETATFIGILHACSTTKLLEEGRRVHGQILQRGCGSDVFLCNSLVDMYAKCGSIEDAWRVFLKMPTHDVVSWNSIIMGYVKCEQGWKALELFQQMQGEGVEASLVTFVGVLNACASISALEEGRRVHEQIIRRGWEFDGYVGSSLIDMYSKCGSMEDALGVFKKMPTRNVVSWSSMILGYVKCGEGQKALELSCQMLDEESVVGEPVTFVGMLNACASVAALEEGRRFHAHIIKSGWESDVFVGNSLINMYSKCGSLVDAWHVFNKMVMRDVVSWTAIILAYVKCGEGQKALDLSKQMQQEGVNPNPVTLVGMLNACACERALEEGRHVHQQVIHNGCESNVFVINSLIDMYAKCGSIQDAMGVFKKYPTRNVVAWNAMILAFVKCGQGEKALELSERMSQEGVEPSAVTFVGMLNACASTAALEKGRHVHEEVIQRGYESDGIVSNCLVDMYAKCGSIHDARKVFNMMTTRDVVSWTSMIAGYSMHGNADEALELFQLMCQEGVAINSITFLSVLSACSHGGLVDKGLCYFHSMSKDYNLSPAMEHYACIVDLLGRAGRLWEAEELINRMSCEPDATVWMSLLGACRVHGNMEIGERVAKRILDLDPQNAACYVLLSNIYAAAGKWSCSAKIQQQMLKHQ